MPTGRVKWYNPDKNFGFIVPDTAGRDVFVHVSALKEAGITLKGGERVQYELSEQKGKTAATKIILLND